MTDKFLSFSNSRQFFRNQNNLSQQNWIEFSKYQSSSNFTNITVQSYNKWKIFMKKNQVLAKLNHNSSIRYSQNAIKGKFTKNG